MLRTILSVFPVQWGPCKRRLLHCESSSHSNTHTSQSLPLKHLPHTTDHPHPHPSMGTSDHWPEMTDHLGHPLEALPHPGGGAGVPHHFLTSPAGEATNSPPTFTRAALRAMKGHSNGRSNGRNNDQSNDQPLQALTQPTFCPLSLQTPPTL